MLDLTFGEQVKIILRRKGMTIKELAEKMEEYTGKKMSRQNLTQRLGRDNFQEQDMRQIAEILGCRFQLSIMEESVSAEKKFKEEEQNIEIDTVNDLGTGVTVGEVIDNFVVDENIAVEQVCEEMPAEEPAIMVEEVQEEPVEEAVYEEPAYEEAAYEEPAYEEPAYEEAAYEEPAYEEAAYEEPVYEEPVYEEPVYEEAAYKEQAEASVEDALKELADLEQEDKAYKIEKEQKSKKKGWRDRFGFNRKEEPVKAAPVETPAQAVPVQEEAVYEEPVYEAAYEEAVYEEPVYEEPAYEEAVYEETAYEEPVYEEPVGDVNPYTGREYETNSVRIHPKKIGYVQVYDRDEHKWIDMTEWAFLGYQEQKKMLLGKDYDPPIYLD